MTKLCITFPWYPMERQSSETSTRIALYNAAKTTWHSLAVRPPNETNDIKIKHSGYNPETPCIERLYKTLSK